MKPEPYNLNRNTLLWGLGILIFLSFFAGLGSGPLFDVDEGAFSEATREMLVSKNYLTTYLNGLPRFDKPILIYWLQLLSLKTFGINELAFRLPSAIAAAVWTVTTYLFVRRERNENEALLSTALLALSLQVSIIAKAAIADALLNACLAVSLLAIFRYWRDKRRSSIYIAFTAIGLGVLAKGPIAILIPVAVSLPFFVIQGEAKAWFRAVLNPTAIALFLVIVLPWYTLEYMDQGQAFIDGFFMKHNVGRFSGSMEGHSGSLYYYLPVVLVGIMPSTGLFLAAIPKVRSRLADPLYRFCLIWFCFVFLFFSLSGTKLPHYMIYGYTPLFIILGYELSKSPRPWLHALWPAGMLLILAAVPVIVEKVMPTMTSLFVRTQLQGLLDQMAVSRFSLLMVAAAILCMLFQALPFIAPSLRFVLGGALLTFSFNFLAMPMAARVMQEPVREAASVARKGGLKIVMWKVYYPSFLVYSGSFAERRRPEPGEVMLTNIDHVDDFGRSERLYGKYGIILARVPGQKSPR
ncbi:MAG: glycosyltransferase family 39 protein [Chlorobiaceae bacterium]|nr:glycosyltransferase family 39 protein [Chlorobiaceae bacterium]